MMKKIVSISVATAFAALTTPALADAPGSYQAGIWVDPDGCQHWVMDLGIEGMMSPNMTKDGRPVCSGTCAVIDGDILFAVDSAAIRPEADSALNSIFQSLASEGKNNIEIIGHTDSDASDAYNMALSQRRAEAVAVYARNYGISVNAYGMGERQPRADNSTVQGKALNRRVEVQCR